MQEAFRRAAERSNGELTNEILRERYRSLGDRCFSFFTRREAFAFQRDLLTSRKRIAIPEKGFRTLDKMVEDCWNLHGEFVQKPVKIRVDLLFGLAYGLRISDTRLDPVWTKSQKIKPTIDELREFIATNKESITNPVYSTASLFFINALFHLYGFWEQGEERLNQLLGFLDKRFSYTIGTDVVTLSKVNDGLANWLGDIQQKQ